MTLLLAPSHVAARRDAAAGGLAGLARSLRADLQPLVARRPEPAAAKAWLTRAGGRCPRDGQLLDFDPWSPDRHRCPRCGDVQEGDAHHRAWVLWYQLWLAERAVHAALLALLVDDAAAASLADDVIDGFTRRYLSYPNRDNVLGPSRPFFSTYLESIWLLQLCVATSLREAARGPLVLRAGLAGRVRDRLIEPSAVLIAGYHEGGSNRQVWNAAALLAAGALLGDDATADAAIHGHDGLVAQLAHGLLADGTWYEGENYHQFAHRGLWYLMTMAERRGDRLTTRLRARFDDGFAAPFLSALPDFSFPARRDSQYDVSLRQWRFAESCELGFARSGDERLLAALARMYDPSAPDGDSGRARSTAEAERNGPGVRLSRDDLGWRALLAARESLPPLADRAPASALLAGQGLAVLRRDAGRVYAALDYGHHGGGHGHPDRLNLLLADGAVRWLDDPGTGSYVERTLHWYRSTLAHNTLQVGGRSQQAASGTLLAYDDDGDRGWVDAMVEGIAPGVIARRTVVVMDDYLVDLLAWDAPATATVDVPLHADGELVGAGGWDAAVPAGSDAPADGFAFLAATERAVVTAAGTVRLDAVAPAGGAPGAVAHAWLHASGPHEWWRATAPGAPGRAPARFHFVRQRGAGFVVAVWSWRGTVLAAEVRGEQVVVWRGVERADVHARAAGGWSVARQGGDDAFDVVLGGVVPGVVPGAAPSGGVPRLHEVPGASAAGRAAEPAAAEAAPLLARPLVVPRIRDDAGTLASVDAAAGALGFVLGEAHYRRSELRWTETGRPRARLALGAASDRLVVAAAVRGAEPDLRPAVAENPLDNEHPDVNCTGLQLHLAVPQRAGEVERTWLVVPESGGGCRLTRTLGPPLAAGEPAARWEPAADGWRIALALEPGVPAGTPFALDVIVNETVAGRERRRGQLVLSGGRGEFVYLRGDRQPRERFLTIALAPPAPPAA